MVELPSILLEAALGAIFESAIAIGGPAVRAYLRRVGRRGGTIRAIAQAQAIERGRIPGYELQLASRLAQAGIPPSLNELALRFVNSPEGLALSQVILREVATVPVRRTVEGVESRLDDVRADYLRTQTASFISLFLGRRDSETLQTAGILCDVLIETAIRLVGEVERVDPAASRTLRQRALEARPKLGPASTPAGNLPDMPRVDQSVLEAALHSYALGLHDRWARIPLHLPGRGRKIVPFGDAYVARRVSGTGGEVWDGLIPHLADHDRAVVLGSPGEGKSVELVRVVHELCGEMLNGNYEAVPVRVALQDYGAALENNPTTSLIDFAVASGSAEFPAAVQADVIEYLLRVGRAVLLFDGLDEILDLHIRDVAMRRIEALAFAFPLNSYVVSCRTEDYRALRFTSDFSEVILEPLKHEEIVSYARSSFRLLGNESLLDRFLTETEHISDMRRIPLLLTLLCGMYEEGYDVPRSRLEIYRSCSAMACRDWDKSRGIVIPHADDTSVADALGRVARFVHAQGRDEFDVAWLRAELEKASGGPRPAARAFAERAETLWLGRQWILAAAGVRGGRQYVRFPHRSFLEYFAAEHLANEAASADDVVASIAPLVSARTSDSYTQLVAAAYCAGDVDASSGFFRTLLKVSAEESSPERRRAITEFAFSCIPDGPLCDVAVRIAVVKAAVEEFIGASLAAAGTPGMLTRRSIVELPGARATLLPNPSVEGITSAFVRYADGAQTGGDGSEALSVLDSVLHELAGRRPLGVFRLQICLLASLSGPRGDDGDGSANLQALLRNRLSAVRVLQAPRDEAAAHADVLSLALLTGRDLPRDSIEWLRWPAIFDRGFFGCLVFERSVGEWLLAECGRLLGSDTGVPTLQERVQRDSNIATTDDIAAQFVAWLSRRRAAGSTGSDVGSGSQHVATMSAREIRRLTSAALYGHLLIHDPSAVSRWSLPGLSDAVSASVMVARTKRDWWARMEAADRALQDVFPSRMDRAAVISFWDIRGW